MFCVHLIKFLSIHESFYIFWLPPLCIQSLHTHAHTNTYIKYLHTWTQDYSWYNSHSVFCFFVDRCVYSFYSLFRFYITSHCEHFSSCFYVRTCVCVLLCLHQKNWYSNGRLCNNLKWICSLIFFYWYVHRANQCVVYFEFLTCSFSRSSSWFVCMCM